MGHSLTLPESNLTQIKHKNTKIQHNTFFFISVRQTHTHTHTVRLQTINFYWPRKLYRKKELENKRKNWGEKERLSGGGMKSNLDKIEECH